MFAQFHQFPWPQSGPISAVTCCFRCSACPGVPRVAGSSIEFDATVTGVAVAAPAGSIQFTVTSLGTSPVLSGTVPIIGGLSTWTTTPASEGFMVTASYAGDLNYRSAER